ncbi:annulin-like protein, partial [Dinothrombium tinctorium]
QDQLEMVSPLEYNRQYDPQNENIVHLSIKTDAVNTPIGEWWLSVGYELAPNHIEWSQFEKIRIFLLFNPWLKEDPVYVDKLNKHELDWYVLRESGEIYKFLHRNTASQPHDYVPWLYNQVSVGYPEEKINGIIEGNWNEVRDTPSKFNGFDASHATFWTGSADILEKFYYYNLEKIGFGQCWVFSGLLITMLRVLGIPSRPVTVSFAGVDFDKDLTIDYEKSWWWGTLKPKDDKNYKWNFHVWVQASMQRPDMGSKYSGWQEIDPSYAKGPVSQRSLIESEINSTDLAYFYAAINGDEAVWENGKVINTYTDNVGTRIITPGFKSLRDDITRKYKPREKSYRERKHYEKAAKSLGINPVSLNRRTKRSSKRKIKVLIKPIAPVLIGDPLIFTVIIKNPTKNTQIVDLNLSVDSIFDNGTIVDTVKSRENVYTIRSLEEIEFSESIEFVEYKDKLRSSKTLSITAILRRGDNVFAFKSKMISILTPRIWMEYLKNYTGKCEKAEPDAVKNEVDNVKGMTTIGFL